MLVELSKESPVFHVGDTFEIECEIVAIHIDKTGTYYEITYDDVCGERQRKYAKEDQLKRFLNVDGNKEYVDENEI